MNEIKNASKARSTDFATLFFSCGFTNTDQAVCSKEPQKNPRPRCFRKITGSVLFKVSAGELYSFAAVRFLSPFWNAQWKSPTPNALLSLRQRRLPRRLPRHALKCVAPWRKPEPNSSVRNNRWHLLREFFEGFWEPLLTGRAQLSAWTASNDSKIQLWHREWPVFFVSRRRRRKKATLSTGTVARERWNWHLRMARPVRQDWRVVASNLNLLVFVFHWCVSRVSFTFLIYSVGYHFHVLGWFFGSLYSSGVSSHACLQFEFDVHCSCAELGWCFESFTRFYWVLWYAIAERTAAAGSPGSTASTAASVQGEIADGHDANEGRWERNRPSTCPFWFPSLLLYDDYLFRISLASSYLLANCFFLPFRFVGWIMGACFCSLLFLHFFFEDLISDLIIHATLMLF